jgi:hypothetical protein
MRFAATFEFEDDAMRLEENETQQNNHGLNPSKVILKLL